MVTPGAQKGVPILLDRDKISGQENFAEKEIKYARQWLYSKNVMIPEESRNPVDTELSSFLEDCRKGGRPKANIDVGLNDSATVILTNKAVEEDRKVLWSELDALQKA